MKDTVGADSLRAEALEAARALFELLGAERDSGRAHRVCFAESCTGGLISALFTSIPGSSEFLWGGFVVYTVAAKTALLGLEKADIDRDGVVSVETAAGMASAALLKSGADFSASVTGFAGPGVEPGEAGPGRVAFGWARRGGGKPDCAERHFAGGRDAVRFAAAAFALRGLCALIQGAPDRIGK